MDIGKYSFEPLRCCLQNLGSDMQRREFITLIGGAAATWPLTGRAQQSKMVRIGALYIGIADEESFKKELREGMREFGYTEGQNIAFEFRSAEGKLNRLPELAAELVRLKVDVIVALYIPCALAAKQATRDIPIVAIAAEPVETGIVSSLAHPGGNVTGVSLMASALAAKSVELFHDMLPSVQRVGVLGQSTTPEFANAMLAEVLLAGGPTGTEIQPVVMIRGPDEAESGFATMVRERAGAVVVQGSLAVKPVTDMAIKYRLPAASTTRAFAEFVQRICVALLFQPLHCPLRELIDDFNTVHPGGQFGGHCGLIAQAGANFEDDIVRFELKQVRHHRNQPPLH
jgi:putative ABC transport system substrate-binding protein